MQKKKVRKNREQWDEQLLGAGMILFAVIVSMVSLLGKAPVFGENKEETKNQAVKIEVPKERIEVITKETDKKTAKSMLIRVDSNGIQKTLLFGNQFWK